MKTKRIDFDIDLAKKIQAGETQGRIVTRDGQPARIICWDKKCDEYPIVALIMAYEGNNEAVNVYTASGQTYETHKPTDLLLEVPDDTPQFQPYDRVLVRDIPREEWQCALYSHYDREVGEHMCADGHFHEHCIPYEGNEHLVGTTDEPKEGEE